MSRGGANAFAEKVLRVERGLSRELAALWFGAPVTHVYDPLSYAMRPHAAFVRRYAQGPVPILFLGMNPGPYGMAQTGVPFGEVAAVRGWLGIEGPVAKPAREHPKRPVDGFACERSEVSGARVWGAVAAHWEKPERFFAEAFVLNYCPLVFMEASGKNRTPDQLPRAERDALFAACDRALAKLASLFAPRVVVGIGRFAADRARAALPGSARVGEILHPSPASPAANRGWAKQAAAQLRALGVCQG
ncbi:MAG: single-stranded DNA-binding protein [Deltaproteobacteria bacterium]|nr:single-stranded DNA-binding protein [Deltaproteobacteria bacterium]